MSFPVWVAQFGRPIQAYAGTAVFTGGANQAGYTLSLGNPARQALLD